MSQSVATCDVDLEELTPWMGECLIHTILVDTALNASQLVFGGHIEGEIPFHNVLPDHNASSRICRPVAQDWLKGTDDGVGYS